MLVKIRVFEVAEGITSGLARYFAGLSFRYGLHAALARDDAREAAENALWELGGRREQ